MKMYQPMLLSTASEPIASPLWISEIKWDGYRALAYVRRKTTRVISRNGRDLTGMFPELRAMGEAIASSAVLDGEIVKIGEHGMPDFNAMRRADVPAMSSTSKAACCCFRGEGIVQKRLGSRYASGERSRDWV